jgi:16S rRNA (adenine1518-N6/adenine1519-N6)-dimethyltransferase
MTEKLFNPDYLLSLCKKCNLQPSKKYGQNYLINPEIIEKIIEAAEVNGADTVVEVGPGFGALTFALADKVKNVIVFEIEKKIAPYWEAHTLKNVQIIWGNVLKTAGDLPNGKYKVVANLPYQITSAVIRFFLENENPPESMTLMVQKEVAERICAKAGGMSLLSVAVQYYANAEIVGLVPRDNFWPVPKVDSAIIKLSLRAPKGRSNPSAKQNQNSSTENNGIASSLPARAPRNDSAFFRLVKAGFANRRKLLIKNLLPIVGKQNKEKLKSVFAELGLSENVRAQELGIEEWDALIHHL